MFFQAAFYVVFIFSFYTFRAASQQSASCELITPMACKNE